MTATDTHHIQVLYVVLRGYKYHRLLIGLDDAAEEIEQNGCLLLATALEKHHLQAEWGTIYRNVSFQINIHL